MYGVAVFPIGAVLHTLVPRIIRDMPELLDPEHALAELALPLSDAHPAQVVLGAFGAAGCPSLAHHPLIRSIRRTIYDTMLPLFTHAFRRRRLEVLFDCFGIRRRGAKISAESWHRDVSQKTSRKRGDTVYGGWVNLDPLGSDPQTFSCIPGNILETHVLDAGTYSDGFAKFDKSEYPALEEAFKKTGVISVPPGHLIVFDQTIAHKIPNKTVQFTSYRLYSSWRITDDTRPIYDKDTIIRTQGIFPVPSGDMSPMYAKLHLLHWRDRLREFSTTFKPEFRETATLKSDGSINTHHGIVFRECPSLEATQHAFPPYTPSDRAMFFPVLLE